MHAICSPQGQVLRIVIFKKNGVQCMVEYPSCQHSNINNIWLITNICLVEVHQFFNIFEELIIGQNVESVLITVVKSNLCEYYWVRRASWKVPNFSIFSATFFFSYWYGQRNVPIGRVKWIQWAGCLTRFRKMIFRPAVNVIFPSLVSDLTAWMLPVVPVVPSTVLTSTVAAVHWRLSMPR